MYQLKEPPDDLHTIEDLRSFKEQQFSKYLREQRRENVRYYDIRCTMKVDFISFSVWLNKRGTKPDESLLQPMFSHIRYNSTAPPTYNPQTKYQYNRSTIYKYQFEKQQHDITIYKCSYNYLKPYIIRVHDPTMEVLEHFQQYLNKLYRYHIKDIELTYDFYNEDISKITQYVQEHGVVSWRGKGFHSDDDTFYANNIRFAHGKGMRSYKKEVKNEAGNIVEVARMEVMYKRPILKKNGIHKIYDIEKINAKFANNYLSFRNFNYRRCVKHMKKVNHTSIEKDIRNIQNGIQDGFLYEMNRCYAEWYKAANKKLKKKYRPDYLYKNLFWDHFLRQCKPWYSFLDGDSFQLSSALMEDGV